MSVAPNAGIVDLDNFLSPTASADGQQGQVPKPLAGQENYVLKALGWAPESASGGTVTSVATGAGLTGGPITTTGTINFATAYGDTVNPYASKTANFVLAAPNGTAGVPTFRAVVAADIPTLNQNTTGTAANVTGLVAVANGGTGTATPNLVQGTNVTITGTWPNQTINSSNGGGTVTSVSTGSGLTGGPITSTGTVNLATAYGDTVNPYASKTTNTFLAAPDGSTGAPTFRAIVAADVPTLNQNTTGTASNVTGIVAVANGGSAASTAQGAMNTFAGAVTSGSYLRGNGTNVVMAAIQAADVPTLNQNTTGTASNVTGTVAVANGGTGATNATTARSNLSAAASGANTDITSVALTTGTVSTAPVNNTDIVNKQYADAIASGIHFHEAVDLASTAALPANTYNNGSSGVGATLTGNANGALSVDSTLTVAGNRILVKNQAAGAQNGVYVVTQVGSAGTPYILTRATDFNSVGTGVNQIDEGDFFLVTSGTANVNTAWVQQTPPPITIGTTAIVFQQFSAPITYTAGTGLNESPSYTFNIANVGTAGTYGSASSVPVFVTNAQGQVTSVTNTTISIPNSSTTATSANTANAIVARDASGNFSAGTITASLSGNATNVSGTVAFANGGTGETTRQNAMDALAGAVTSGQYLRGNGTDVVMSAIQAADVPTLNQNTTGTSSNVTGTVAFANGGTGATTRQNAMDALAGAVSSGQYLRGNGTDVVMSAIQVADVPTLNQNTTGTAATAANVTGVVAVANGGTGATAAAAARTNLGATTLGGNLYTLTNVAAVAFPRFNADNTISALDAATFRTAIGAGTGSGTVTGVTGTAPIVSSGGTAPAISISAATTGAAGSMSSADKTKLDGIATGATNVTNTNQLTNGAGFITSSGTAANVSGTVAFANGGTGATTRQDAMDALAGSVTSGQYLRGNGTDVVMSAIQAADVPTLNQNTSGNAATSTVSSTSNRLATPDTRTTVYTPPDLSIGLVTSFQENTSDGLSDGGTYNGLWSFRQYGSSSDWSGGPAHQLGFTENGNVWHRIGNSATWGTWYKFLDTNSIVAVANGGTGTATPSLVAGTNVTISGTFPNQTINASGGGGGSLAVLDEGTTLTSAATSLNFTGAGVTATNVGSAVTINISGGGGGSTPAPKSLLDTWMIGAM